MCGKNTKKKQILITINIYIHIYIYIYTYKNVYTTYMYYRKC